MGCTCSVCSLKTYRPTALHQVAIYSSDLLGPSSIKAHAIHSHQVLRYQTLVATGTREHIESERCASTVDHVTSISGLLASWVYQHVLHQKSSLCIV